MVKKILETKFNTACLKSSLCVKFSILHYNYDYSTGVLPKRLLLQTFLKPSKRFLYFLSLSIRILLFMLLVVACDVERNPGPETNLGVYTIHQEINVSNHLVNCH